MCNLFLIIKNDGGKILSILFRVFFLTDCLVAVISIRAERREKKNYISLFISICVFFSRKKNGSEYYVNVTLKICINFNVPMSSRVFFFRQRSNRLLSCVPVLMSSRFSCGFAMTLC